MLELVFTSAQNGLIPGRSGFCSVAWTEGMPQNLIGILENLSAYNVLYPPNDPRSANNPVCCAYQKIRFGGRELYVMSRIAFAGLDYTGRTNKIAHHIVIENESELDNLQYGPISAFLCEENFFTEWSTAPRLLPRRHNLKSALLSGFYAETYSALLGNPEWAGHIADTFMASSSDPGKYFYCEYDHETHGNSMLMLIAETVRLMRREYRTQFTFNTYFAAPSNDIHCFFRAALPDCQVLASVKRFKPSELISLISQTPLPPNTAQTPAVIAARSGIEPDYNEIVQQETTEEIFISPVPLNIENDTEKVLPLKTVKSAKMSNSSDNTFETAKTINPRVRLIIFIACAVLLLTIIAISSIIVLSKSPANNSEIQKEKTEKIKTDIKLEETEKEKTTPQKKPTLPPPAEKKKVEKINIPLPPAKKTINTAKTPAAKKNPPTTPNPKPAAKKLNKKTNNVTQAVKKNNKPLPQQPVLSAADGMKIFIGFTRGEKSFVLPEILHSTQKIDLKISSKWDDGIKIADISKFITKKNATSLTVYSINPLEFAPDKDNPSVMNVVLIDKSLEITEPSTPYSPRKKYIENLTFHTPHGKYIWNSKWRNAYIRHIPKGSVNKNFTYDKSKEEKLLKDYIDIANDDFRELKNHIDRWNKVILEYRKNTINLVVSDLKSITEDYEAFANSLFMPLKDMDFKSTNKLLSQLCRNLSGLNEDDTQKFKNYLQKQAASKIDEIKELRKKADLHSTNSAAYKKDKLIDEIRAQENSREKIKLNQQLQLLVSIVELENYISNINRINTLKNVHIELIGLLSELVNYKVDLWEEYKKANNHQIYLKIDKLTAKTSNLQELYRKQYNLNKQNKEKPLNNNIITAKQNLLDTLKKYSVSPQTKILENNKEFSNDTLEKICQELTAKVKRSPKRKK